MPTLTGSFDTSSSNINQNGQYNAYNHKQEKRAIYRITYIIFRLIITQLLIVNLYKFIDFTFAIAIIQICYILRHVVATTRL